MSRSHPTLWGGGARLSAAPAALTPVGPLIGTGVTQPLAPAPRSAAGPDPAPTPLRWGADSEVGGGGGTGIAHCISGRCLWKRGCSSGDALGGSSSILSSAPCLGMGQEGGTGTPLVGFPAPIPGSHVCRHGVPCRRVLRGNKEPRCRARGCGGPYPDPRHGSGGAAPLCTSEPTAKPLVCSSSASEERGDKVQPRGCRALPKGQRAAVPL